MTTDQFMRVLSMRAHAWGHGHPVHDYELGLTYMPDCSVVPFRRRPAASTWPLPIIVA